MNFGKCPRWIIDSGLTNRLGKPAVRVLFQLLAVQDGRSLSGRISVDRLTERIEMKRRTALFGLKDLVDAGVLEFNHRTGEFTFMDENGAQATCADAQESCADHANGLREPRREAAQVAQETGAIETRNKVGSRTLHQELSLNNPLPKSSGVAARGGGGESLQSIDGWEEAEQALQAFGVAQRDKAIGMAQANGWEPLDIVDLTEDPEIGPSLVLHRIQTDTKSKPGPTRKRIEREDAEAAESKRAEAYAREYHDAADRRIAAVHANLEELAAQLTARGIPERLASKYPVVLGLAGRIQLDAESVDTDRVKQLASEFESLPRLERNQKLKAMQEQYEQQLMTTVAAEVRRTHASEFPTRMVAGSPVSHPGIELLTDAALEAERRVLNAGRGWHEQYTQRAQEAVPA